MRGGGGTEEKMGAWVNKILDEENIGSEKIRLSKGTESEITVLKIVSFFK